MVRLPEQSPRHHGRTRSHASGRRLNGKIGIIDPLELVSTGIKAVERIGFFRSSGRVGGQRAVADGRAGQNVGGGCRDDGRVA